MIKEIKLEGKINGIPKRRIIAEKLNVTPECIGLYLRFKRSGPNAERARNMAYEMGGRLRLIEEVDREETIKILDRKGNIEKVITTKK